MKFFIGLILIVIGLTIIYKTEWMVNNFGRNEFFERKLGTSGGSRLGYKLIGIIFIFLGILSATGSIDGFMGWALSPLTKYNMQ
ncbi:MAG: hypothetical protein U9Q85_01170 [Patescibacteria group bacterium]|nr:hypothetical protein [Patescibacteria group bacterium]